MERYFVKDALKLNLHDAVVLKGWAIKRNKKLYLHDMTGEMELKNLVEKEINDRDVIVVVGEIADGNEDIIINVLDISILNQAKKPVNLLYTENDFLKKSYQYYHETYKIKFLEKINALQSCVREFLFSNLFIELNNPILWTSVQEYGRKELKVIDPSSEHIYFLPQSPNQQNLISVIGGIERNFQFNHCFRVQDDEESNDSVCEFTQLAITAAFVDSEEGMELVEKLIKKLLVELKQQDDIIFERIDYENSLKLYGDDKPDFRFKEFYTPIVEMKTMKGDWESYSCLYIPYYLKDEFTKDIAEFLQLKTKFIIYKILESNIIQRIYGNMFVDKLIEFANETPDINIPCYVVLIKGRGKFQKDIIKALQITICQKMKRHIPRYAVGWVTGYPYVDLRKKHDCLHENIGQNIFTKIEDRAYKETSINYHNCKTCGVDLVINGVEIASGGEKENCLERFIDNLKFLGIENYQSKLGFYIEALKEGAPPFFTIGIGWERLLYVLLKPDFFSEVFIFPKDQMGKCFLTEK